MKRQLTEILNLPEVIVKSQKIFESTIILEIEKPGKTSRCPKCGTISRRLHQNHWSLIKDLPWGKKEVFLRINRRQFKCEKCQKPFSEKLDFVVKRQKYTKRYALSITQQVVKSDLLNVAKQNNLTESEVQSMINQVAKMVLPLNLKGLKRVGIDEITLVKGQGKFVVVLVDLDKGKLIGMVSEKKSTTLEKVLKSWGADILLVLSVVEVSQIEEVSMDLCKQYKNLMEKRLFDQSKNLLEGTLSLADWLLKAAAFLPKTVRIIKNWFAEIVGYFESKTNNGMVEGINNLR